MSNWRALPPTMTKPQLEDAQKGMMQAAVVNNNPLGYGKTWEILTTVQGLRDLGFIDGAVVFTKKSIMTSWIDILNQHFPALTYQEVHGDILRKDRVRRWTNPQLPDLFLANIDMLVSRVDFDLITDLFGKCRMLAAVDEAHVLRNVNTVRHKHWQTLRAQAARVLLATGTMLQTSPHDLYGVLAAAGCPLPHINAFLKTWCDCEVYRIPVPHTKSGYIEKIVPIGFNHAVLPELRKILQVWVICRPDIELPVKLTEVDRWIDLSGPERAAYEEELEKFKADQQKAKDNPALLMWQMNRALAKEGRLRAILSGKIAEPGTAAKDLELLELYPELTSTGKAIVYSPYSQTLYRLKQQLETEYPQHTFPYITGDATLPQRQEAVLRMRSDDKCRLLLLSDAGSDGLNLQCCSRVVFFDRAYNPAVEAQVVGRIFRQGQENPCLRINFNVRQSLDEKILRRLQQRQDMADVVKELSHVELSEWGRELLEAAARSKKGRATVSVGQ